MFEKWKLKVEKGNAHFRNWELLIITPLSSSAAGASHYENLLQLPADQSAVVLDAVQLIAALHQVRGGVTRVLGLHLHVLHRHQSVRQLGDGKQELHF
ncbi:hypothetical protein TYRP_015542 [Tyrophagus putrescentiae]|nr:hypothetical protein TYRP_015542 [Tyrophagus putrescentiae]